jgi:hypothetical protein
MTDQRADRRANRSAPSYIARKNRDISIRPVADPPLGGTAAEPRTGSVARGQRTRRLPKFIGPDLPMQSAPRLQLDRTGRASAKPLSRPAHL